jgi:hypothetical protein
MRWILILVSLLATAPAFGRTAQEFRDDITARDRQITELRGQVERLRYVAGDSVATKPLVVGTSAALTTRQHAETIQHVDQTREELEGIRQLLRDSQERTNYRTRWIQHQMDEETMAHRLQVLIAVLLIMKCFFSFLIYQRCGRRG